MTSSSKIRKRYSAAYKNGVRDKNQSATSNAAPVVREEGEVAKNDLLSTAAAGILRLPPPEARAVILELQRTTGASLRVICNTLGWPRSSFYAAAHVTPAAARQQVLVGHIKRVFHQNQHQMHGYRRVHQDLLAQNIKCSPATVRNLMRKHGLTAADPRRQE